MWCVQSAHIIHQSIEGPIIHSAGFIVILTGEEESLGNVMGSLLTVN